MRVTNKSESSSGSKSGSSQLLPRRRGMQLHLAMQLST